MGFISLLHSGLLSAEWHPSEGSKHQKSPGCPGSEVQRVWKFLKSLNMMTHKKEKESENKS